MGLGNRTAQSTFVNIKNGQLAVKMGDEIKMFSDLTGNLVDLAIEDDEYDGKKFKKLVLTVNDGTDSFTLQMRYESGYARMFCNTIPNADLSQPITFSPAYSEENGKKNYKLFLKQGGKALKHAFTKDNPNGLPQLEKVTFKGEVHWDNTAQMGFYTDLLLHTIKPKLSHPLMAGGATDSPGQRSKAPLHADVTEPVDDLPF